MAEGGTSTPISESSDINSSGANSSPAATDQAQNFTWNLRNMPIQINTHARFQGDLGRVVRDMLPVLERRMLAPTLQQVVGAGGGGAGAQQSMIGASADSPSVSVNFDGSSSDTGIQVASTTSHGPGAASHATMRPGHGSHGHGHSHHGHVRHSSQPSVPISIPQPPASNPIMNPANAGEASFVINFGNDGNVTADGSVNVDVNQNTNGAGPGNAPAGGQQIPNLRTVIKALDGSIPFVILLLAKILYDHRLGILMYVAMYGTFYHANSSLRRLIAQRDNRNFTEYVGQLTWIITFLSASIFFIYYVCAEQHLHKSLYFQLPTVEDKGFMGLWSLLWIVCVTDFTVKFAVIIVKALLAMLPKLILPYKKKGKYYMMFEVLCQFYRSAVPILPWLHFLMDSSHGGQWFSVFLLVVYIICKIKHMWQKFKELRKFWQKFQVDLSYGTVPDKDQLRAADNSCPICQDKFTDPILLSCKHIFCEDCVSMWFDREKTCPMCRANIVDDPAWRDGTTSSHNQLY